MFTYEFDTTLNRSRLIIACKPDYKISLFWFPANV